jgi:hypothetical protein
MKIVNTDQAEHWNTGDDAALAPHADDEGVHLTAAVWLVQATAE